ncbi:histone deacetylase family protein [Ignicoccus islandicus]|nr:histone deacetylase [Ignicoccus islandicus]
MKKFREVAEGKFPLVETGKVPISEYAKVHCLELIEAVLELNKRGGVLDYGDTYVYEGSAEVLEAILGALYYGYQHLEDKIFYSPYGGLHHASRCEASGFCPLNDVAVLIQKATEEGKRVAYLDFDAHHGNGTQEIFYERDDVLTVSIHAYFPGFYPGTGHYSELGRGNGYGYSLNVPLPPWAGDEAYLKALELIVERAVNSFEPDLIVAQMGVDGHRGDPIGGVLNLTTNTYKRIGELLSSFGIPIIGAGGGGYGENSVRAMMAELIGLSGKEELWEEVREEPTRSPSEAIERVIAVKRFFESQVSWF